MNQGPVAELCQKHKLLPRMVTKINFNLGMVIIESTYFDAQYDESNYQRLAETNHVYDDSRAVTAKYYSGGKTTLEAHGRDAFILAELSLYRELGSIEELRTKLSKLAEYEELGTVPDIINDQCKLNIYKTGAEWNLVDENKQI